MNKGIRCPQCGGNKLNVLGQNNYECLYCGTIFIPASLTNNQMNTNVQSETSGASIINVNVSIPNNSPNNIGESQSFNNINSIQQNSYSKSKNKTTAGILGIFLGAFGGHHFYLGNTKELFNETIRLNTSAPSLESFASAQKNPCLTNWKLSYAFASAKAGST